MTYLLGKATIEDFDDLFSEFEINDPFRTDHGQTGYQVYQSTDEPNELVVIFEWNDDEDPRSFFESPEMVERMQKAGLKGRPDLTPLKLVDQKSAQKPSA